MKKDPKGITLIALVITIIVMLILVAVTINVAMGENGLIATTQKAARDQEYETIYDVIKGAIVLKEDGTINTEETKNAIIKLGYEVTPKSNDLIEIKGKKGTYTYKLTTKEISKSEENNQSDTDLVLLEKYFSDKAVPYNYNVETKKFIDNPIIPDAATRLLWVAEDITSDTSGYIWFKYEGKIYKVFYRTNVNNNNLAYCSGDVFLVYKPAFKEGTKIKYSYDGTEENKKDWIVLYDNGTDMEILSPDVIGNLELGAENIQDAISSYNSAIYKINEYCNNLKEPGKFPSSTRVRSVGSDPENPLAENTSKYSSNNLSNLLSGAYQNIGYSSDQNYEKDLIRMTCFGVTSISQNYWLASRDVSDSPDRCSFNMICIADVGIFFTTNLWDVSESGAIPNTASFGVRPVVKLPSNYAE